jgi:hypothetical protein
VVTCQEVAFARGTCRIEIDRRPNGPGLPAFVAHVWLTDASGVTRSPVTERGAPVEIRGETEALALSTAIGYLESRFGAISEYAHGCTDTTEVPSANPASRTTED